MILPFWLLRWRWSKLGCIFSGYVIYFVGCMQVYSMVAISYVRYNILKNNKNGQTSDSKLVLKSIIISILLSGFWSTVPIVGWSYYSLEDSFVSCAVEYNERSLNVISYNICMFLFVFIFPLALIIYSNVMSLLIVNFLYWAYLTSLYKNSSFQF